MLSRFKGVKANWKRILFVTFFAGSFVTSCFRPKSASLDLRQVEESVGFKEIEDGFYVGSATTADGETVYFGMEELDSKSLQQWKSFKQHQEYMTTESKNTIYFARRHCDKQNWKEFLCTDEAYKAYGMEEQELSVFVERLKELKSAQKLSGLANVGGGLAGFSGCLSKGHYVVYASKEPIKQRMIAFPKDFLSVKEYFNHYNHIVMVMASGRISSSPVYWNRGIHRMPKSFIDGTHKRISMLMHKFTGTVAKYVWGKEYLLVSALPSMSNILDKHMDANDYWKKGDGDEIPQELSRYTRRAPYFRGFLDTDYVIKVEALNNRL